MATARAPPAAAVSALPSSSTWRTRRAAKSGWKAGEGEAASGSSCQSRPEDTQSVQLRHTVVTRHTLQGASMKKTILIAGLALAVGGAAFADKLLINGAGATFPFPLYSKWFSAYNKLYPDVLINYQSIGSGGGIKQITERTVDFGASDAPLTDEQMAKAQGIQHIPTVMGAVVVVWNLPGVNELRIAPETLASIYLGKVTKWNDPALQKDNPGVKLPETAITVAHRSDGSGTTNIFTAYLSKVSPEWKTKVGAGGAVNWPAGLGGKGNEGVSGLVKQTPGGLGYVELIYALQNKMTYAQVKNLKGNFITPSLASVSAASNITLPDDAKIFITNTD